jgi:hypothetical protein
MFRNDAPGELVAISGSDPALGAWKHRAFVPSPLALLTTEGAGKTQDRRSTGARERRAHTRAARRPRATRS